MVSQKTNFRFRLLVAEDFSTDGTRDIIEKYQLAYPEIVFPFFRGKNLGAFENSRLLFKEMKSKYIALCEGDDFWTDRNKLQKQVDFLEAHPNYAGCFHNSEERYEDEDKASFLYCNYPAARNISFCDLSFANVIPSCSMMYRNGLFKFPGWFHELKMGDWPLNLLNARFGDFWFMPVVMAVHRLHKKSIWMLQDADKNRQATIEAYDEMIKEFTSDPKLSECLKQGKEAFVNSGKRVVSNGFKGKAKDVIIRMIEKL